MSMSSSPDSSLLRRTIELNYSNKKRSSSLKWIVVNGFFFLVFAYDLWRLSACGWGALRAAEALALALAAANGARHAAGLLPARRAVLALTPRQRRLLGLHTTTLDSSFREVSPESPPREPAPAAAEPAELSPLARARVWGAAGAGAGAGAGAPGHTPPPSPPSPQRSAYASPTRVERDEFIADHRSLADYLRRREESEVRGAEAAGWGGAGAGAGAAPAYQLAALDTEGAAEEGAAGAPQLWRRLQLDPRRLTQFNLNLRLWLHVTILQRLVRELDALDAALLPGARVGEVSCARLRKLCASAPALAALLPFLEPFPDQRYVVQRYRELASGGCLSEYKWNGGNASWDESKPTDAELVVHAFAAYLNAQLPAEGGAGGVSVGVGVGAGAGGVGAGGAGFSVGRGSSALGVRRTSRLPPHYVLEVGGEALEVGAGRNNVVHALLLLLAAAARRRPPALRRLHLGRAGLNMLWIIGR